LQRVYRDWNERVRAFLRAGGGGQPREGGWSSVRKNVAAS
jgi:hypothetical protein